MWSKIIQIIIFVSLTSILALIQVSFISALPSFLNAINLILIFLVFSIFFYGLLSTFGFVLISGFWLDMLSFHFFGFYLIILFLTSLLTFRILNNLVTNRSLYSFILLIISSTLVYNFLAGLLAYIFFYNQGGFFIFQSNFWLFSIYQIILGVLAAILLFSLASALTKRFKPFFLEKH